MDERIELIAHAEQGREHEEYAGCKHKEHDQVGHDRADQPVRPPLLQSINDATQTEHDNDRPKDDADRNGKDVQNDRGVIDDDAA